MSEQHERPRSLGPHHEGRGREDALSQALRDLAFSLGTNLFGVASLVSARDEILSQGGPEVASFPRAISLGIRLRDDLVDVLPDRADPEVARSYGRHCYEAVNERLDVLSAGVAHWVKRHGWRALAVPASQRIDDQRICGLFSHKLAAHLAGLGWIGKSCLLVTPEAGPRVRWGTVLTDAPVETGEACGEDRCETCRACVDICPVKAFTGRPFRPHEPREARYDARACDGYFASMRRRDPSTAVYGLCLYVCPFGRSGRPSDLAPPSPRL